MGERFVCTERTMCVCVLMWREYEDREWATCEYMEGWDGLCVVGVENLELKLNVTAEGPIGRAPRAPAAAAESNTCPRAGTASLARRVRRLGTRALRDRLAWMSLFSISRSLFSI